jgi:Uncharacterized protein involved in copper resistance
LIHSNFLKQIDHPPYIIEACVASLAEALIAQQRGADQIELCAHLEWDGLTPDMALMDVCIQQLDIPVKVMIRPKKGDFIPDALLIEKMIQEIRSVRQIGIERIVLGLTTAQRQLDLGALAEVLQEADGLEVTIHKAIDTCHDPVHEVTRLKSLHRVHSILTSGGQVTAISGAAVIKEMIKVSEGEIQIIAAGSVTEANIQEVHHLIGAAAYHGRRILGALL